MGIRINKCIGYGIIGDVSNYFINGEDDDAMYDPIPEVPVDEVGIRKILNDPEFMKLHLEINGLEDVSNRIYHFMGNNRINLRHVGNDGGSYGMIFTLGDDWYRHDDIIDYIENDSNIYNFEYLEDPAIYPDSAMYICDQECPTGFKSKIMTPYDYKMEIGTWGPYPPLAHGRMFDSYKIHWRPTIPSRLVFGVFMANNLINKELLLKSVRTCKATWWA